MADRKDRRYRTGNSDDQEESDEVLKCPSDIFKDMGPRLYESVLKFVESPWLEMGKQDGWSTKYQLQEISEIANSLRTAANCRCENANRT